MEKDIRTVAVERTTDKKVRSAVLSIGPFKITFMKFRGKIRKATVSRTDKEIIGSSAELWIPDEIFFPAIKRARTIFAK